jgi:hypothetical protein
MSHHYRQGLSVASDVQFMIMTYSVGALKSAAWYFRTIIPGHFKSRPFPGARIFMRSLLFITKYSLYWIIYSPPADLYRISIREI